MLKRAPVNMEDRNENILLLKKSDPKTCVNILHHLVDGVCHRRQPTYQDYSKIWSLQEWWSVSDTYRDIVRTAVKETWTKDQMFQELESLPEDYRQSVSDVVNSRRADLREQLLAETHGISQSVLTDFDWKLKLVMSSDKISTVQEPMLALDMDVQSQTDRQTVSLELGKEELRKLITSLEAANKAMVQLKS